LEHFQFTSFNRITGYQSQLSASDTSYAVTALLEYEPKSLSSNDGDAESSEDDSNGRAVSVEAFNNAYDALGTHSVPMRGMLTGLNNEGYDSSNLVNGGNLSANIGLGAGLRHAMALQKSIIQTAVGLMERGSIALLKHFRYAHVTSSSTVLGDTRSSEFIQSKNNNTGNEKRDHILSKPLALTRLAQFLMTLNRENGKWTGPKARPLVLIADKPRTNTCLVVGYEYPDRPGHFIKNRFGKHFELTAESMNCTYKFDSFDSNVVEVAAGDVQRFMEQLHYFLDTV
jgi:cell division control protein 45